MLYGLRLSTATAGALITSTTPAFTILLSFLILNEKSTQLKFLAIISAIAGVVVLNFHGEINNIHWDFIGNVLILLAVISGAMLSIFIKKSANVVTPFHMAFITSAIPLLIYSPIASLSMKHFSFHEIHLSSWFLVIAYTVLSNILFPIFWNHGQVKVKANTASLFTSIMPVATTIMAIIFLNEKFSVAYGIGMFLVLLAILLGVYDD